MSILIKGMEMPESCYYCPFADGVWQKNKRCLINGKEMPRDGRNVQQNHLTCPLIEVPPHGRLGDLDELEQMFVDIDNAPYSGFDGEEPFYSAEDAALIIRLTPTVIPADKDGEA